MRARNAEQSERRALLDIDGPTLTLLEGRIHTVMSSEPPRRLRRGLFVEEYAVFTIETLGDVEVREKTVRLERDVIGARRAERSIDL